VCWRSLLKYNAHKLAFRSNQCVFLGYSPMHKGYKFLDKSTGRIYIYRDVVFAESVFHMPLPVSPLIYPLFGRPSLFLPLNRLRMIMFVNMTYPTCPLIFHCKAMLSLCRFLSPMIPR
jgi:hypothetical protein